MARFEAKIGLGRNDVLTPRKSSKAINQGCFEKWFFVLFWFVCFFDTYQNITAETQMSLTYLPSWESWGSRRSDRMLTVLCSN